jgi:hypothetical protein
MRIAALLVLTIALLAPMTAIPQTPGSMGGSVGKQDKSISGSDESSRPAPAATSKKSAKPKEPVQTASKSSCQKIVGTWKWHLGLQAMTFSADGQVRSSLGVTGTWTCSPAGLRASYSNAVNEQYTVSPDGDLMFVKTSWGGGISFTATRIGAN